MVPLARVERAAHGLGIRCSILLSNRGDRVLQDCPRFNTVLYCLSIIRDNGATKAAIALIVFAAILKRI